MGAFIKLHISSFPLNYLSLSVAESTYTSVEVRLFSVHLFVNRHQLSEVRDKVERRNTMKAEKEEDTILFVPEVYRMPFFWWKWRAEWLQALRFSCYRPASRCTTDSETQLSSGVPSLTWKPGFEKMVRVGREKNFSTVFFLIDPVARLLGEPK